MAKDLIRFDFGGAELIKSNKIHFAHAGFEGQSHVCLCPGGGGGGNAEKREK